MSKESTGRSRYAVLPPGLAPLYRRTLVFSACLLVIPAIFPALGIFAGLGIMPNGDFVAGLVDLFNGLVGVAGCALLGLTLLWARSGVIGNWVNISHVVGARWTMIAISILLVLVTPMLVMVDIATSSYSYFIPASIPFASIVGTLLSFLPRKIAIVATHGASEEYLRRVLKR